MNPDFEFSPEPPVPVENDSPSIEVAAVDVRRLAVGPEAVEDDVVRFMEEILDRPSSDSWARDSC
jgi:hypothetical protein